MLHCDEKKLRIDPFGELNSLQKKNVQSAVRGLNSQKQKNKMISLSKGEISNKMHNTFKSACRVSAWRG